MLYWIWIYVTQVTDQWQVVVSNVMNFLVPQKKKKWGIYWLAKQLLSSQKYLSSTELFKSEEF